MFPSYMSAPTIISCTNLIKIAASRKLLFFSTITTRSIQAFLNILEQQGLVRRFIKVAPNRVRVYLNWHKHQLFRYKIKFFQTKTPIRLTYKTLLAIDKSTCTSILMIESDLGVITHKKALRLKKGGTLLGIIL